jgi:hypothetical protein
VTLKFAHDEFLKAKSTGKNARAHNSVCGAAIGLPIASVQLRRFAQRQRELVETIRQITQQNNMPVPKSEPNRRFLQ